MTGVTQEQTAYTLESTTWTPADAAFELYKDYKVEIVVKAAEGDTFASNAGATLRTGAAATLTEGVNVRTNGNRMTISYTFAGEEHPRVTLQNYLQSDAVTSVGMLEGGSRVNKDANGRRKYTAASWNVFAEKFNAAVAAAGHEGLAPEAYTKARTDLAAAIAGLKLAAQNCECTLTEITGFDGKELDLKGAESISVTLGAKYSYSKECEKHPGAEPSVSYELIGGPAGASLTGNVLTVTQTGDVQVRCTVRLGDVTKSAVASYPVVKNPVTELDLAKEEAQKALSSAETVYSAGQKDYPDAAWKAFETAYKAMKAVPENADAAALKKLADDLAKAQAALTKKTPGVVQDKEIIVTPLGRYQIVSAAKKTAKLVSVKNNKAKKLNVPASVKLNGVTCQVVEVGANVMKNNKSLTKVILGKNVAAVGKQAFFGCKNLKSVQLKGKALKKVGKSAFKKTSPKMVVSAKKMNKKDRAKLLKTMRKAGMSKKGRVK